MSDRDREIILHPLRWPLTYLPLKRGNPFEEGNVAFFNPNLGVKQVASDQPIEIRMGTIWDFQNEDPRPTKVYDNVDALLADGWVVD